MSKTKATHKPYTLNSDWLARWPWGGTLAFGILFSTGLYTAFAAPSAVTITNNRGGDVAEWQAAVKNWRANDTQIIVAGLCNSACTMVLALPKTCVTPDAVMGFHGASAKGPLAGLYEAQANGILADHYPPSIRTLFWEKFAAIKGRTAKLNADQLIALGVNQCAF